MGQFDRSEQANVEAALRGEQPLDVPAKSVVVPYLSGQDATSDVIAARYEQDGWHVIRIDPSELTSRGQSDD